MRILKWSANERKTLSLSDHSLEGKVLEASLWRVRGRSVEGTILGDGVRCPEDIGVSRAKTGLCEIVKNQFGIN
jgi:hypothetical protein